VDKIRAQGRYFVLTWMNFKGYVTTRSFLTSPVTIPTGEGPVQRCYFVPRHEIFGTVKIQIVVSRLRYRAVLGKTLAYQRAIQPQSSP
jgi:hypothetical protein